MNSKDGKKLIDKQQQKSNYINSQQFVSVKILVFLGSNDMIARYPISELLNPTTLPGQFSG